MCTTVNEWNEEKKLKQLPMLQWCCAWAVYDALGENQTDMYSLYSSSTARQLSLKWLSLNINEDWLSSWEELARRRLHQEQMSADGLACDVERLLDRASPGLPGSFRERELRFHFINALPEKVAFQPSCYPFNSCN